MRKLAASWVCVSFLLAFTLQAYATPVTDFENEVRAAYASYRAALAKTNASDAAGSAAALKAFVASWSEVRKKWERSPPPHYAGDGSFSATLASVGEIAEKAASQLTDLPKAHVTLEKIRDELAELRARNGVTTFSDRMNAYHEAMELVLGKSYQGFSADGLAELREDAAVLRHLALEIEKLPPGEAKADPAFRTQMEDLKASVESLLAAVRRGDADAARKAVGGLKRPYAQMFLRFG